MNFLTLDQLMTLQRLLIDETGGSHGLRDEGGVASALDQPRMTFGGSELYPTLEDKAVALAFSLIQNHPFVDGNKRIGLAAMAIFLRANGFDLAGTDDEFEEVIIGVAGGKMERIVFLEWIVEHVVPRPVHLKTRSH